MVRNDLELKLKERYIPYFPKQKYVLRYGVHLHGTNAYKVQGSQDGVIYTFLPHEVEQSVIDSFDKKNKAMKIVAAVNRALHYFNLSNDRTARRLAIKIARDVQRVYTEG